MSHDRVLKAVVCKAGIAFVLTIITVHCQRIRERVVRERRRTTERQCSSSM